MTSTSKNAGLFLGFCAALVLGAVAIAVAADSEQVDQLKKTRVCPKCDLRGADLVEADLYGAQLVGADLSGAILDRANLQMANLSGAIGANLSLAITDWRTVCPDDTAGPCK